MVVENAPGRLCYARCEPLPHVLHAIGHPVGLRSWLCLHTSGVSASKDQAGSSTWICQTCAAYT